MDIPVLVLAAGQSSRMRGRDKLAELVGGIPQLTRITQAACSVSPSVYVALTPQRMGLIKDLPAIPLMLAESAEGMGGTLRAGVACLPDCTHFMLLLADMPDMTAQDMRRVIAAVGTAPDACIWRGATAAGQPGHPILFDAKLRPQFATLHGDSGGEAIVRPLRDQTCLIPLPHARTDLDTPEDWARWRALRGE
jgi:molybdenum cofactor cytidylyltransferase